MLVFVCIAAFLYLALVQLRTLFFETSYFEVKQLEVHGAHRLTREEVIRIAQVAPSMNVFGIDSTAIQQRLQANPLVDTANVELSGLYTLVVSIRERLPLFFAKVGPRFIEVGQDGHILSVGTMGASDLPIFTGLPWDKLRPGDAVSSNDEFVIARRWVDTLGPAILKEIAEINLANPDEPYLFLVSGERVMPKSLDDFKARYTFLGALLDNLKRNAVEPDYLDMRAQNEIVVMPRRFGTKP